MITANLFPADEFHFIGPFRFPVYNDVNPGEARAIRKVMTEQAEGTTEAFALASRIAKDKGIKVHIAMQKLQNLRNPENEDLLYEYFDEVNKLSPASAVGNIQRDKVCTVVMQLRGELKDPETNTYTRTTEWSAEDTDVVPSKMLDQIFEYIMWEQNGWPKADATGTEGNGPSPEPPVVEENITPKATGTK